MSINEIEQFVLCLDRRGQLFDKECDLELRVTCIDRFDGNRRGWCYYDQPRIANRVLENLAAPRRRCLGIDLNGYGGPMKTARRTDVDDLGLRDGAVGQDRQISTRRQDVGRAPVQLDDPAVGAA